MGLFNSLIINGKKIPCTGNNIVIRNNTVVVDGKIVKEHLNKSINIVVNGDVSHLDCDGSVEVHGNSGDIDCGGSCTVSGNVNGNIDAGGSIVCGDVSGSIDAGGSVRCNKKRIYEVLKNDC